MGVCFNSEHARIEIAGSCDKEENMRIDKTIPIGVSAQWTDSEATAARVKPA
jgi:hypothetical protein